MVVLYAGFCCSSRRMYKKSTMKDKILLTLQVHAARALVNRVAELRLGPTVETYNSYLLACGQKGGPRVIVSLIMPTLGKMLSYLALLCILRTDSIAYQKVTFFLNSFSS